MADSSGVKVVPIRTLDDFLLGTARFQVPNFKDLEKWNNRVYQNLLYYQTNYFLTYLTIFLLVSVIHPTKMMGGIFAVGCAAGLFYYLTSSQQPASEFKKAHPIVFLMLMFVLMYLIVYLLGGVAVFLVGMLLPVLVVFTHASMRLRNLRNKVINKMEWIGMKKTPMGVLLDTLGLETDIAMERMNVNVEDIAKNLWTNVSK